jgi:hypothetical protein
MHPASPGLSFHQLGKARDKNFWSLRVNCDLRLIVHKTQASLLLRPSCKSGYRAGACFLTRAASQPLDNLPDS